ncbi:MAG TPA: beta-glucuronidase [Bacteroidetes bacterium]|nr:beta-glucuronidase [Bacteroidota bacterium]
MKNTLVLVLVYVLFQPVILAQEERMMNIFARRCTDFSGFWKYIVDPYENGYYNYRWEPFDRMERPGKGAFFLNAKPDAPSDLVEYDFDRSDSIQVPGDWNTQKEKLFYYEGTVWYKKSFDYQKERASNRVFVYFGAANYRAEVYLNGKKLGTHTGGFTPFHFEITDHVRERDNFLIVKVDNRREREGVPTLNTDWWNYGGLTREVMLVETPGNFIQDYFIRLRPGDPTCIEATIRMNGPEAAGKFVRVNIPELGIRSEGVTDENGWADLTVHSKEIRTWSPEDPYLYEVILETTEERLADRIGFRTIQTRGRSLLLNGRPVFLRGISIHEESPFRKGRAWSEEDARQLLLWAKELGCNFVRLAHYPHNEHMVRMADKMGLMVWAEIPVYWTILWDHEETYRNAENQLSEMILRDRNRASVVIWSVANETPVSEARNRFLTSLAAKARELDPTRLISAALEQTAYRGQPDVRTIHDPFAEVVDVLSFNQYIGWYDGLPDKCGRISWKIEQNKPVLITEFGAGAKQGLHGERTARWTEEYQEYLYEETLKMIGRIDGLQGCSPWILKDFRSPRRVLPGIQDGWNRKGLISEDGKKKKAFTVLQRFYLEKAGDGRE